MGGSSGGGSSSGQVSYPGYMQTMHESWLDAIDAQITVVTAGDNPYTTAIAYDPDCVLNATNYIISLFYDDLLLQTPDTDWGSNFDIVAAKYTPSTITAISKYVFGDIFSDANMTTLVTAFQTDLESRRDTDFKPAYKIGMLNANAVMTSAFVIGDSLLTAEVARNVAKFSGELYYKNEEKKLAYEGMKADANNAENKVALQYDSNISTGGQQITDATYKKLDFFRLLGHLTADANRIKIVAKTEEAVKNIEYDVKDDLYDLEVYTYGQNMLAGIAGGTTSKGTPSTSQSVLGGALSGAAAGAAIGGPVGAGIGAVVGGLAGLL